MMNRKDLLKSALATPELGAWNAQSAQGTAPARTKTPNRAEMPNILWICTDQQRFDTIGGFNNPHIRTPNLRKLVDESVTFTNAFVQNPICSPSRASFLTGRYPCTTGLRANGQSIRPSERLVTRVLADFGYECGLVGKLHLAPVLGSQKEKRIDDGYSQFFWSHDPTVSWPGDNMYRAWLASEGVKMPAPPADSTVWGVPISPLHTQTAWCFDTAIRFVQQQKPFKPWLMSVNVFQPHRPFRPCEGYFKRYDPENLPSPAYSDGELENKPLFQKIDHRAASGGKALSFEKTDERTHRRITAAYYAMIEEIDTQVGRLLAALEETGQARDTIVIFMSDHGEMLGDHGIYLKGPYFYDCAMRVPLIICWPQRYRSGLTVDSLVEFVDLAPTLLEAAGIPPLPGMQGRSLAPLLRGEAREHRDSVYMEYYESSALYEPPAMATAVRTKRYKLAFYHTLSTGELYDLVRDPGEVHNLWNSAATRDVREELLMTLLQRMSETIDPLPLRKTTA